MYFVELQERFWEGELRTAVQVRSSLIFMEVQVQHTWTVAQNKILASIHLTTAEKSTSLTRNKTIATALNCTMLKLQQREEKGHHSNKITEIKFQAFSSNTTEKKHTQTVHWKFKQINTALKHTEVTNHPHLQEFPQQTFQKLRKKKKKFGRNIHLNLDPRNCFSTEYLNGVQQITALPLFLCRYI